MKASNIFDLKMYAYMLLKIQFFNKREEKSALESQLKLMLRELSKIKSELSYLDLGIKHTKMVNHDTDNQQNELDDLLQKIQNRIKSLPQEPIGEDLSTESESLLTSYA